MTVVVAAELNDEANRACVDRSRKGYVADADVAVEFVVRGQTSNSGSI